MTATDPEITPELLLHAYATGVFPMSDNVVNQKIFWVDPDLRGVFPLDAFHVSNRLARRIRQQRYRVTVDQCFDAVVTACAERTETWINAEIFDLYAQLHSLGFAHSVEVMQGDTLVGGVYGVALNGGFFGESMFSRRTDTSKIALSYLVARLKFGGFSLFDIQFQTDHLKSLGALEISRKTYRRALEKSMTHEADFFKLPMNTQPSEILHLSNHTS